MQTQEAEANDTAGSLERMLWRRSSVNGNKSVVLAFLVSFLEEEEEGEEDDGGGGGSGSIFGSNQMVCRSQLQISSVFKLGP